MPEPGSAIFTPNDIVEKLDRIKDSVAVLDKKVDVMCAKVDTIADHEQRIRSLERVKWVVAGVAAMGGGGLVQLLNAVMGS